MDIRNAVSDDIPELRRLLLQVGDVHHQIRPDIFRCRALKYNCEQLQDLLNDPQKPVFVAVKDGTMLGYCFCQWREYRNNGVLTNRLELYIDDLCVEEACRDGGVGTALYRHAVCYAQARECHFITLNVWCGNEPAMTFYEKMGLRPRNITMEMPLKEVPEC